MYCRTEKGVKFSPIHGRFPINIYHEAAAKAELLMEDKKQLVI
jgi:hypothetical protein